MLELYYSDRRTLVDFRRGPLGRDFDRFAAHLNLMRYSPEYGRNVLGVACRFNAFLIDQKITHPRKISQKLIASFLDLHFVETPGSSRSTRPAKARRPLEMLWCYLTEVGVVKPPAPKPIRTPYSWVLDPYLQQFREECSPTELTLKRAKDSVTTFLEAIGKNASRARLRKLSATRVDSFIQQRLSNSAASLSGLGSPLRRFFRYCAAKGFMAADFSTLVPPVCRYRHSSLPKGLNDSALNKLVSSIDRSTPVGARDYAIMLLLMGYGIRGISAAALRLDDIDWQHSQIRIRAQKGGKEVVLPLLEAVGEALIAYFRLRVANSPYREVFLNVRAPFGPLNSMGISVIARRHLIRAGVHILGAGTRTFRHSWAIRALAHGSPMKAIADVLGHRYIDTTFIYAKADLETLRDVAMPWPEKK
ncbi:MAG: tyrosine-type recombinase/integrase [Verrucomicrobia bacterium]|nr:tyrosine-type recombinase/integrase [Verrucomicrobiota bacterium]